MKVRPATQSLIQKVYQDRSRVKEGGFASMLGKMVGDANALQSRASSMAQLAVTGSPVEAHDVMIAGEEARLAFDLMLEVRNKLLEVYLELMQMRM